MLEIQSLHVVGAIIVLESKVLACRRARHKTSPGKWEFPGGKVEPGESSHSALEREIMEELSLDCQPVRTYDISETEVGGAVIRLETILCRLSEVGKLNSSDHDQFTWVSALEAEKLDWATPDLPAVGRLIRDGII